MTREARRHNFSGMWVRNGTWGALEIRHKFQRRVDPRIFVRRAQGRYRRRIDGLEKRVWSIGNLRSFLCSRIRARRFDTNRPRGYQKPIARLSNALLINTAGRIEFGPDEPSIDNEITILTHRRNSFRRNVNSVGDRELR